MSRLNEIIEIVLPSYLAPYLINNDCSHVTEQEIEEIDNYLSTHNLRIVDIPSGEPEFKHTNDLNSLGGDCYTLTAITNS